MRIVDYKIFTGHNPEDLSIQVANKLIDGWKLYKGPFSAFDERKDVNGDKITLICQAMVVYEKAQRPYTEEANLVYRGESLDFYEVTERKREDKCLHGVPKQEYCRHCASEALERKYNV